MTVSIEIQKIGILLIPTAQLSAVLGLTDLFETAECLRVQRGAPPKGLQVLHVRPEDGLPPPEVPLTAIILPPSLNPGASSDPTGQLVPWLLARRQEGTVLCSVCAGAFLLAETGLLNGRPATTHWAAAERFSKRFPEVLLDTDKLVIDEGDLITAGGLMAWVDLGLKLVERCLGPAVMVATARYLLVDPGGREQRFYSDFIPHLTHSDTAILQVQHWLQTRSSDKITLAMMAAEAKLGARTFLRRFQKATQLNPIAYLQQLRAGKARELLELSSLGVDEIAWQVGYQDPSAFRKIFRRLTGLSPSEYRHRFTLPQKA